MSQAPAQANGLDDIVARGTLKVTVPQDFPPFGSVGPDMKPRCLDIDTAKLLADQLKVKLELTPVNSTNHIPFLTTGKIDSVDLQSGQKSGAGGSHRLLQGLMRRFTSMYSAHLTPPSAAPTTSRARQSA